MHAYLLSAFILSLPLHIFRCPTHFAWWLSIVSSQSSWSRNMSADVTIALYIVIIIIIVAAFISNWAQNRRLHTLYTFRSYSAFSHFYTHRGFNIIMITYNDLALTWTVLVHLILNENETTPTKENSTEENEWTTVTLCRRYASSTIGLPIRTRDHATSKSTRFTTVCRFDLSWRTWMEWKHLLGGSYHHMDAYGCLVTADVDTIGRKRLPHPCEHRGTTWVNRVGDQMNSLLVLATGCRHADAHANWRRLSNLLAQLSPLWTERKRKKAYSINHAQSTSEGDRNISRPRMIYSNN